MISSFLLTFVCLLMFVWFVDVCDKDFCHKKRNPQNKQK